MAAFWSRAGVAHLLTRPGDTPPFQRGGMGDHSAGMTLAAAICAALLARERTGTGQLVTTSLYRQGAYTVSFDLNTYLMTGQPIAIGQRETMGNPCMNNYAAGDGRRFWIVGLGGRPALAPAVPRRRPSRVARPIRGSAMPAPAPSTRCELIAELDEIFATSSLDEWAEVFAAEPDFFWSPVNSHRGRRGRRAVPRRGRHRRRAGRRIRRRRWWPPRRISTARRGRPVLRHRNSGSTPTKFSPNSRRAAAPDRSRSFTNFGKSVTLSGESRHRRRCVRRLSP